MGRKVSVSLEADVGKFIVPVETAVKAVDDLGDKVDVLDRELDKIPPDAAKAAAAFGLLGASAEEAAGRVKNLGQQDLGLSVLDAKIRATRGEVKKLADEFGKTGDLDVFKKLGDSQGRLGALTKIRKDLAESIENGVKDGIGNVGSWPGLQQAAMQFGATFAVPLVAAVGGALTGGVGLGIAGVGIAGAVLGDPERFQSAWGVAARTVKGDFIKATEPFTLDVFDGIARIGPLVNSWHLDKIFKDARGFADPLFDGIEGLSTGLVKGVGALVSKGGPAVHALSDGMIILGQASEDALGSIADGAEGGAYALKDLSTAVGGAIRLFGGLTGAAEKAYGFAHNDPLLAAAFTGGASVPLSIYSRLNGETSVLTTTQHGLEVQAAAAAGATDGLAASQHRLSDETLKASTALGTQLGDLLSLDQANDAAADGIDRVRQSFKENGYAIEGNSEKAKKNREVLQGVVGDFLQQRDAAVAAGDGTAVSIGKANAVLRQHLEDLRAVLRAHGDDTSAVDRYLAKLDSLDGKVISVRVDLNYTSHLPSGISLGNLLHHDAGGRVQAGVPSIVGENRPEVFVPDVNGTIIPSVSQYASQYASTGSRFADMRGGASIAPPVAAQQQTLRVVMQYPDGRVIRDQVIEWNANRGRSDPATYFLP